MDMAGLMSGLAPVKMAVDQIIAACKEIVQSGAVPGAEQPCGQIISLATAFLPIAAQAAMQGPVPPAGAAGPTGPPPGAMA